MSDGDNLSHHTHPPERGVIRNNRKKDKNKEVGGGGGVISFHGRQPEVMARQYLQDLRVGIRVRRVLPMATWKGVGHGSNTLDSGRSQLAPKPATAPAEECHRRGRKVLRRRSHLQLGKVFQLKSPPNWGLYCHAYPPQLQPGVSIVYPSTRAEATNG